MSTNNELLIRLARAAVKTMSLPDADIVTRLCTQLDCALAAARTACGERTAAHSTLEKAREVTNCPADVDLQDHLKALVAENLTMIRLLTDISENHVEYFSEGEDGMFAGVPLDYVSEINMYVSRDVNAENPFPATDSILREAEARGVEKFVVKTTHQFFSPESNAAQGLTYLVCANEFVKQLREGKAG
ncbi:hypothetical protein [Pseudocitrobacter faecalis]